MLDRSVEHKFKLGNHAYIDWRPTPWDSRALGIETAELLSFGSTDDYALLALLQEFEAQYQGELLYTRVDAADIESRRALYEAGYFQSEASLGVQLNRLQQFNMPSLYSSRITPLVAASDDCKVRMLESAESMYRFSRFHEDPLIPKNKANLRMKYWVEDMLTRKTDLLVCTDAEEKLNAYIFYSTKESSVELILGGSLPERRAFSPFFFASLVEHFRSRGYERIRTNISFSNLGVLKIYLSLGFSITGTNFDYHRHILR